MSGTREIAYAKLNLSLDVLRKRPDGYHDLLSVMQSTELGDDIFVELTDGGFSAETNRPYIPCDDRNVAVKAAKAFLLAAGIEGVGVHIRITKLVPVCAGLGGGSADAAAVLRALNKLCEKGLSAAELESVAKGVGSDIPFCVAGGTALAEGRGEVLSRLKPLPECTFVICIPQFTSSTPELFSRITPRSFRCHPDTEGLLGSIEAGDLHGVAHRMYNVFEDVLDRRYAAMVKEIKFALMDSGAMGAVMSGTGSAVFGMFDDAGAAVQAQEKLKKSCREVFLTRTKSRIEI